MIHFNELYITDDGKNLVVDAEIDDFTVYDSCYINKITATTAANKCGTNPTEPVEIYVHDDFIYYDLDCDGIVTDEDVRMFRRTQQLLKRISLPTVWTQVVDNVTYVYDLDVNRDGVVDVYDIYALVDYIVGGKAIDGYHYDVNEDGEVNVADINVLNSFILDRSFSVLGDCEEQQELEYLLGRFKNANDKGVVYSRHVRRCLDAYDLGLTGKLGSNIILVTVEAMCDGSIGNIEKELGCGWDTNTTTGAAYNGVPIYRGFLDLADSHGDDCNSMIDDLAEYSLQYNAFDFSLRMGDWCTAQKYWELLTQGSSSVSVKGRGCGCRGSR